MYIKKKQGWQSLYRVTTIVAVLLLLFVGKIGYKFSLAYQTDASSLKNHFTPGHNTTYFEENFPEQSIIPGGVLYSGKGFVQYRRFWNLQAQWNRSEMDTGERWILLLYESS